jgi:hypothetical protein
MNTGKGVTWVGHYHAQGGKSHEKINLKDLETEEQILNRT